MLDLISAQNDFLEDCRRKNLSGHTVRAYQQDLNDFRHWLKRSDGLDLLSKDTIGAWISDLAARRLAPTTIKRRVACLKVLFRWLEDEGRIEHNPFLGFRTHIKIPKKLPKNLSKSELRSLMGSPRALTFSEVTFSDDCLLLALEILFSTGIRVGELCSIQLENLDLETGIITIKGKGNRERKVYLVDQALRTVLSHYLHIRAQKSPLSDCLLVTQRAAACTPNSIRIALHKHVETQGLSRTITPHMFRHTTATQLLENGVDIRYVQKLLGHASITTTEIYTHVSDVKLHEAIRGANLRGR
ncbi:MAG: tyrosine-type recombinase/integrase [Magnetovibrio sp.]|nr:tyrosine-type recombinase/integrase [Magnetovibrio sp.]